MVVVGLLADTHGVLDAAVCSAFRSAGVERILHAGDVVDGNKRLPLKSLIGSLEEIAPVTAVRGNTDDKWAADNGLPATTTLELSGVRFHIHHGDLIKCSDDASEASALELLRPASGWRAGDVIVSGHSHVPRLHRHVGTGVVFLNPGSCGPQRFKNPRQFAVLECDEGQLLSVSAFQLAADGQALARPWDITDATDDERRQHKRTKLFASNEAANTGPDPDPASCSSRQQRVRSPYFSAVSTAAAQSNSGFAAGDVVGKVRALFVKPERGASMQSVETLSLIAREGIDGDVHRSALTPRQCLVLSSRPDVAPGAFRENILVEFAPGKWPPPSGSVMHLGGDGAALRITFACETCGKGAAKAGVALESLKFTGWEAAAPRGMLSTPLASGSVAVDDEVRIVCGQYAALSDSHAERVRALLARVPHGKVTSYTQLHKFAGAPTDYSSRGFPGLLKKALADGSASVHRVLDSQWRTTRHFPEQADLLQAEGVPLDAATGRVFGAVESVAWAPTHEELFESGAEQE